MFCWGPGVTIHQALRLLVLFMFIMLYGLSSYVHAGVDSLATSAASCANDTSVHLAVGLSRMCHCLLTRIALNMLKKRVYSVQQFVLSALVTARWYGDCLDVSFNRYKRLTVSAQPQVLGVLMHTCDHVSVNCILVWPCKLYTGWPQKVGHY